VPADQGARTKNTKKDDSSEDEDLEKQEDHAKGKDLGKLFAGKKDGDSDEEKQANFMAKLGKKERKAFKNRAARDKIPTHTARVLTGGITAASTKLPQSKGIVKKGLITKSDVRNK